MLLSASTAVRPRRRAERLRAAARALGLGAPLLAACGDGDAGGAAASDGAAAAGAPWFEEVAAERGLDFRHVSGHDGERYLMPEIMAGGGALVDLDGDGDLEAYLVQSGRLADPPATRPGNRLFENVGGGRFRDRSEGSGADDRGYGMGVAAGDADGDGRTDLYVTNAGPNVLLANAGGLRFDDVTTRAGVGDPGFGASAGFLDADRDGDLDLFVLNYIVWTPETELTCRNALSERDYCSPQTYDRPAPDVFYRNEGDGTFRDATAEAGVDRAFGPGLGLVLADLDDDGLVDAFVANDGEPHQLWRNRGGSFENVAVAAGCAVDLDGRPKAGMGATAADVDDDGDPDLLVCNLGGETDSFYLNEGGSFRDATVVSGLAAASRSFTRFGMAWVDFDHDGRLDLYQANGRVSRQSRRWSEQDPYAEPNLCFRGEEGARFVEVEPRGGTREPLVATSRAAVFGDVDGDGAIDVLVVNRDGPAHLLRNVAPKRGGWIGLRVLERSGADALGARVELRAGERRVVRDVASAYSYCAANDPLVHVGLGPVTGVTDVVVRWPDGEREAFGAFDGGRVVVLRRGTGTPP